MERLDLIFFWIDCFWFPIFRTSWDVRHGDDHKLFVFSPGTVKSMTERSRPSRNWNSYMRSYGTDFSLINYLTHQSKSGIENPRKKCRQCGGPVRVRVGLSRNGLPASRFRDEWQIWDGKRKTCFSPNRIVTFLLGLFFLYRRGQNLTCVGKDVTTNVTS